MSKYLTFSLFTLTFSLIALRATATPSYWVAAETAAATGDASSGGNVASYSGYYCTVEAATTLFGPTFGTTLDDMTAYLSGNFDSAQTALQTESAKYMGGAGAAGLLRDVSYANGQYELSATYGDALVGGSAYLAMLFYANGNDQLVRVMMNDVSGYDMMHGNVAFNDKLEATAGTFGNWTAATIPEPASGLLLLLGMAGLVLRRKKN